MELGVVGHGGLIDYGSMGLGLNRIGSPRTRHLLPVTAFPVQAKLKRALNTQENSPLSQVPTHLNRVVASL
jgi:hypothetical protein